MYIIHYEDSKGNKITDRACNRMMFLSMLKVIKKKGYKILGMG